MFSRPRLQSFPPGPKMWAAARATLASSIGGLMRTAGSIGCGVGAGATSGLSGGSQSLSDVLVDTAPTAAIVGAADTDACAPLASSTPPASDAVGSAAAAAEGSRKSSASGALTGLNLDGGSGCGR